MTTPDRVFSGVDNQTRLTPARYFESIDNDTERLLAMAELGLDAAVPCCPGWTVRDVVSHVAMVYEHKVRVMADNGWPAPWPPTEFADQEPIGFLADAKAHLFAEFADHEMSEETTTFYAADPTIGFWARRMALEIAVHRYDGELAHDMVTPIADDLALDGVDEVLRATLAGPWWESRVTTRHPIDAVVAVETAGRVWYASAGATSITIAEGASAQAGAEVASVISGAPETVFLWLWGRVGDDRIAISGDVRVAAEFRARLAECTG